MIRIEHQSWKIVRNDLHHMLQVIVQGCLEVHPAQHGCHRAAKMLSHIEKRIQDTTTRLP
jgi:hypothetical protein